MTSLQKTSPALICLLLGSIAGAALAASASETLAAGSDGSFVVALTAAEEDAIAKAKAKAKAAKQHQAPAAQPQPPAHRPGQIQHPPARAVAKPVPAAPKAAATPPPPPPGTAPTGAYNARRSSSFDQPTTNNPNAAPVAGGKAQAAPAPAGPAKARVNVRRHLPGHPVAHQAAGAVPHRPAGVSPAVKAGAAAAALVAVPATLHAVQAGRQRAVVPGTNQTIVKEADKRVIIKNGNHAIIRHDEAARFVKAAPNAKVQKAANGNNITIINSTNNTQIYNITNNDGQLVRRYRRDPDGREFDIIDNRANFRDHDEHDDHTVRNVAIAAGLGLVAGALIMHAVDSVPEPHYHDLPPDKYVVRYNRASDDDVYEALSAPPVQRLERRYTLDEVRETYHLRQHMRRIDLDDINFETGSWDVTREEFRQLERMARGMLRAIERNPNEVFMIEGYTDAVGATDDNLSLSDRRAEAVAEVLTREFNVPPENLTTQGYGEQYLLVDTSGPNRENRRVAVRRITPLIAQREGEETR